MVDGLANKEHEVGRCVVSPDDLQGREFVGMKILDTSPSRVGFQLSPQVCPPNFLSNENRLNSKIISPSSHLSRLVTPGVGTCVDLEPGTKWVLVLLQYAN